MPIENMGNVHTCMFLVELKILMLCFIVNIKLPIIYFQTLSVFLIAFTVVSP